METFKIAAELLQAVGNELGLPLALDADGACGLNVEKRLDLTLRVETRLQALLIYTQIDTLPTQGREAVLRRLLASNHVWEVTKGATWSIVGDQVVLARLLAVDLEPASFTNELSRFIDVAMAEQIRLSPSTTDQPVPIQTTV